MTNLNNDANSTWWLTISLHVQYAHHAHVVTIMGRQPPWMQYTLHTPHSMLIVFTTIIIHTCIHIIAAAHVNCESVYV